MRHITSCEPTRWIQRVVVVIGVLSASFATVAAADIYKCVAKGGAPLYQNFPCSIDSLGLPSSRTAPQPSAIADAQKPKVQPAVALTTPSKATEPRVGMTGDEVRSLLGDPENVEEDEPSSGRISIWRYAHGMTLQLDHKQRVVSIQREDRP